MSFNFLSEHQFHVLLRIFITFALFFGTIGILFLLTKRYTAKQKYLKENGLVHSEPKVEILIRDGWRIPKKRNKKRL